MKIKKRYPGKKYYKKEIGSDVEKLDLKDIGGFNWVFVNEELMVLDMTTRGVYKYMGWMSFFILFLWLIVEGVVKNNKLDYMGLLFSFLLGSAFMLYGYFAPDEKFEFNRLEGTLTFPNPMTLSLTMITMPFEDVLFSAASKGSASDGVVVMHPNGWVSKSMFEIDFYYKHRLSLITWFMDRNRPLPPGEAFDAYREKDNLRRKLEGFPRPLYPSKYKSHETKEWHEKNRKKKDRKKK